MKSLGAAAPVAGAANAVQSQQLVCLDASPDVCEELQRELESWLQKLSLRSCFLLAVVPLDQLTRADRQSLLGGDVFSAVLNEREQNPGTLGG